MGASGSPNRDHHCISWLEETRTHFCKSSWLSGKIRRSNESSGIYTSGQRYTHFTFNYFSHLRGRGDCKRDVLLGGVPVPACKDFKRRFCQLTTSNEGMPLTRTDDVVVDPITSDMDV